jgi:molecular chaperone GrpE
MEDQKMSGDEMEQPADVVGAEGSVEAAETQPENETPEGRIAGLEARIAELDAQKAELNDLYLRKAADFENYRKRMAKDKADAIDFANQSLLLDLIPTLDDFERALKSAADAKNAEGADLAAAFSSLFEGIGMTESRLYTTLENKWGLKRYVSAGEPFDPERHEALMMEKSAETAEAVVQDEFVKGYLLKDRVIRTAKVKVLMPEAAG